MNYDRLFMSYSSSSEIICDQNMIGLPGVVAGEGEPAINY